MWSVCPGPCLAVFPTLVTWAGPTVPAPSEPRARPGPVFRALSRPPNTPSLGQQLPSSPSTSSQSFPDSHQTSSPKGPLVLREGREHLVRLPLGGMLFQALHVSAICFFTRCLFPSLHHQMSCVFAADVADRSPNPFHLLPGYTATLPFPASLQLSYVLGNELWPMAWEVMCTPFRPDHQDVPGTVAMFFPHQLDVGM